MATKNTKHIHRTAKGKVVDMDMLRQRNELTPAVGNSRVNARGDELGPGGQIVRSREEIVKDYYDNTVSAVPDEKFTQSKKAEEVAEEVVVKEAPKTTKSRAQKKVESTPTAAELAEFEEADAEWVEDDEGNFVKKDSQ